MDQIASRLCKSISKCSKHSNYIVKYIFCKAVTCFYGIIGASVKFIKDKYNIERVDVSNYRICKQKIRSSVQWQDPVGLQLSQLVNENFLIDCLNSVERKEIINFICTI